MPRAKLFVSALVTAGLLSVSVSSTVFATPLTQIKEGKKCGKLNKVIEKGIWSYKCTKVKKKKLWRLNGMSSTTTVAPRKPPSGDYWEKQHLDSSNILTYGNPYRLYICTNGGAESVLTLWVNVLNTWVKRVDSFGTTSDSSCSGDYPTTQSFYWFIDWSGTPIPNGLATLNFKVTGFSTDYFYSRLIWPSQAATNQGTTTTTTTTTTIAPTTTIASRPSGTWYSRWMTLGAPNDSTGSLIGGPGLNVVYGQPTELIFCLSSGENPSTLEVKDGGVWRKVASGFRQSSDTRRCSNSAEPITFSFYWVVDANGTKNYRKNGKEYKSRDLEIKLTTSAGVRPMLRSVGSIESAGAYDLADTLRCSFGETSYC